MCVVYELCTNRENQSKKIKQCKEGDGGIADLRYEMWDVRFGIGHGAWGRGHRVSRQRSEVRSQRSEGRRQQAAAVGGWRSASL